MKKIIQIILSSSLLGILLFASCTKDWEEMNTDPNSPTNVPASNLLGQSIRYFADNYYDAWFNMNNTGTYAGHLGKIQYLDESRYFERESSINNAWTDLYYTVNDLENAKKLALEEGNQNLYAAALTFQTFVFSIGTDGWRDMPFFDAIKGNMGIVNPTYNTQEEIYPALLDSLKKAGDIFAEGYLQGFQRMGRLYLAPIAQEGALPVNGEFRRGAEGLPESWVKNNSDGAVEVGDGCVKVCGVRERADIYYQKIYPARRGDRIILEFAARGKGSGNVGAYFYSGKGDGAGAHLKHVDVSDEPSQYKLEIEVENHRDDRITNGFRPVLAATPDSEIVYSNLKVRVIPRK